MENKRTIKGTNGFCEWVKKNVTPLATLIAFIATIFTGYFWLEGHYAKAEQLKQLEQRFEVKVISDSLRITNERIWQLEDRLEQKPNDLTAKEELRKLKEDKIKFERDIQQFQQH